MAKILITGTSGFIGRKLAEKLKKKDKIVGYCRHSSGIRGIGEINDDILNINKYQKEFKGAKQVYHLAALINFSKFALKDSLRINVLGTKRLLKVCQKIGINKFLFVSAGATLGFAKDKKSLVNETSSYTPPKSNSYAYSKYLAEKEVLKYSNYFDVVIVNPATVYGNGNSSSLVKLILSGKLKIFFPGGTSYIDIDDLVKGLQLAMKLGKNKNRYILSAENLTYKDLIKRIAKFFGKSGVKFCLPSFTFYPLMILASLGENFLANSPLINSNILEGFYKYRYFDTRKARRELGFLPKYKIEDSVKKIVNLRGEEGRWGKQNQEFPPLG